MLPQYFTTSGGGVNADDYISLHRQYLFSGAITHIINRQLVTDALMIRVVAGDDEYRVRARSKAALKLPRVRFH